MVMRGGDTEVTEIGGVEDARVGWREGDALEEKGHRKQAKGRGKAQFCHFPL